MLTGFELTLFLLGTAVLGVVAFRLFHLPPILGYLIVGIVIGPYGLGVVKDNETMFTLAEFGVVFLMFSIGLEFSLPKLSAMRHIVFGLGLAQVVGTIVVVMLLSLGLVTIFPTLGREISWEAALALGSALSMSSTAIISKLLTERLELETEHGRHILGILLFQDLALVPLLITVPALVEGSANLMVTLGWAILKAILVLALLLFFGQKLMGSWLRIVVQRRSQELFMLNLLLMTLGIAWITDRAGLSLALGAFIAGILISETEYKHQVEADIRSFRDVLLGLFFITTGMLLNVQLVWEYWWLILLLLTGLIVLKFGLIAGLARLFGTSTSIALRTGLALAQAGEFGFVLLNQANALHLMDPLLIQIMLASMVLSMLIAPFILAHAEAIVMKMSPKEWMLQSLTLTQLAANTMAMRAHVIIVGFGRHGQHLAQLLNEENIPYHALERDLDLIHNARMAGAEVSYSDASRRESLIAAGIHRAAALVITCANTSFALTVLHYAHELAPALPVIVRSYDDTDIDRLLAAGATEVVPEILESSLMLASHALVMLGVPLRRVLHRVQDARDERYASLRGYFHGISDSSEDSEHSHVRLQPVTLTEGAHAVGQTLSQIELDQIHVEVAMLRRGKGRVPVEPEIVLEAGDILVLRGVADNIARAEQRLFKS